MHLLVTYLSFGWLVLNSIFTITNIIIIIIIIISAIIIIIIIIISVLSTSNVILKPNQL
jgi:hypothetical protein